MKKRLNSTLGRIVFFLLATCIVLFGSLIVSVLAGEANKTPAQATVLAQYQVSGGDVSAAKAATKTPKPGCPGNANPDEGGNDQPGAATPQGAQEDCNQGGGNDYIDGCDDNKGDDARCNPTTIPTLEVIPSKTIVAVASATSIPSTKTAIPNTETSIPPTKTPIPSTKTAIPQTETLVPSTETTITSTSSVGTSTPDSTSTKTATPVFTNTPQAIPSKTQLVEDTLPGTPLPPVLADCVVANSYINAQAGTLQNVVEGKLYFLDGQQVNYTVSMPKNIVKFGRNGMDASWCAQVISGIDLDHPNTVGLYKTGAYGGQAVAFSVTENVIKSNPEILEGEKRVCYTAKYLDGMTRVESVNFDGNDMQIEAEAGFGCSTRYDGTISYNDPATNLLVLSDDTQQSMDSKWTSGVNAQWNPEFPYVVVFEGTKLVAVNYDSKKAQKIQLPSSEDVAFNPADGEQLVQLVGSELMLWNTTEKGQWTVSLTLDPEVDAQQVVWVSNPNANSYSFGISPKATGSGLIHITAEAKSFGKLLHSLGQSRSGKEFMNILTTTKGAMLFVGISLAGVGFVFIVGCAIIFFMYRKHQRETAIREAKNLENLVKSTVDSALAAKSLAMK